MKKYHYSQYLKFFLMIICCFTLLSARKGFSKKQSSSPALQSVHIVDRNGFSETIANKERLSQFQQTDFLKPQAYQKVLRIYERDDEGNIKSQVTTYHSNGNPKQYLEIKNGRAYGRYQEWHENGILSTFVTIVGGNPDVTDAAQKSWLFNGLSYVWDDEGRLKAEIPYSQGSLEGISVYYHPEGTISKQIPFSKGVIEGDVFIYKSTGELHQQITYVQGKKNGSSITYRNKEQVESEEQFSKGLLINGQYFDKDGTLIAKICDGTGEKIIFENGNVKEIHHYANGIIDGEVRIFTDTGRLKRIFHVKNGIKHGEEIDFYVKKGNATQPQPRISFFWFNGKIHGLFRSWYSNGQQESQKELANNKKQGVSTYWYNDGSLMMIEEYEKDLLIRGDYFRKGEKSPISQIIQGKGIVTMHDANGNFIQKVSYANGKPE